MTRLIPAESVLRPDNQGYLFFSKDKYNFDDILIAQTDDSETHYDIIAIYYSEQQPMKTGYRLYVIKKKDTPEQK